MSSFNSPLPRTGMPSFHESSSQRSPRDSDATAKQWSRSRDISKQVSTLTSTLGKVIQDVNKLRRRSAQSDSVPDTGYFPFRVLQSPDISNQSDAEAVATADGGTVNDGIDRSWRLFRVRSGAVGLVDVSGTDGAINPDDSSDNPNPDFKFDPTDPSLITYDGIDFLVPALQASFYVWIDCTDITAPFINFDTTAPGGSENNFWKGSYILIATIDTVTNVDEGSAIVRQYRRSDVPLASGCSEDGTTTTLPV